METLFVVAIVALVLYLAFVRREEYYLTCPSPDVYASKFRLKRDDRKALMKRCEKVLPTGKSGDFDTEVDSCMTSCYPGFTFTREDQLVNLCEKFCKDPKSKECLDCVTSFQCEQTVGNQFPFVCTDVQGATGMQIKKFTGDELKAYELMLKSL